MAAGRPPPGRRHRGTPAGRRAQLAVLGRVSGPYIGSFQPFPPPAAAVPFPAGSCPGHLEHVSRASAAEVCGPRGSGRRRRSVGPAARRAAGAARSGPAPARSLSGMSLDLETGARRSRQSGRAATSTAVGRSGSSRDSRQFRESWILRAVLTRSLERVSKALLGVRTCSTTSRCRGAPSGTRAKPSRRTGSRPPGDPQLYLVHDDPDLAGVRREQKQERSR